MTGAARLTLAVALALILLLISAFLFPDRMLSPGALSPGHEPRRNDCFACHAAWRGAPASRCLLCHELPRIGLPANELKHSFHQELIERDCSACHASHKGYFFAPPAPVAFTHALLRIEVRGRCELCHVTPRDSLHRGIDGGCAQCHGTDHWTPASFRHEDFFVLDRDHEVACRICHAPGDFRRYSCYGCHEHTPAGMRALHREEGIRDIGDCVACHRRGETD